MSEIIVVSSLFDKNALMGKLTETKTYLGIDVVHDPACPPDKAYVLDAGIYKLKPPANEWLPSKWWSAPVASKRLPRTYPSPFVKMLQQELDSLRRDFRQEMMMQVYGGGGAGRWFMSTSPWESAVLAGAVRMEQLLAAA